MPLYPTDSQVDEYRHFRHARGLIQKNRTPLDTVQYIYKDANTQEIYSCLNDYLSTNAFAVQSAAHYYHITYNTSNYFQRVKQSCRTPVKALTLPYKALWFPSESTNNTSDHPSYNTSSAEAKGFSAHRIERYLAENDSPVPYASPALHDGGNLERTSAAAHGMNLKLQQFDAEFYGQEGA
ncbi:b3798a5b-1238-4cfb-8fa9-c530548e589d [Sclerotinia trifoliorum]|uniref:B3798a5b-1238-4cfb-8fa9-c530548e589d n=1 Tax=Sclerotinia trifoliorum TaxID=28548 RepID=A0A8H2W6I2_9HELO|nr:b3798a5b-1238-4cfb-8fa9-c530548e589d [Sclerotinia trifoliorum]